MLDANIKNKIKIIHCPPFIKNIYTYICAHILTHTHILRDFDLYTPTFLLMENGSYYIFCLVIFSQLIYSGHIFPMPLIVDILFIQNSVV